jgi:hypothetical protein
MARGFVRSVLSRAFQETQFFRPLRLYSSIRTILVAPFVQYALGIVTLLNAAIISVLAGLVIYAVLTVGEFGYRLATMPATIWREQCAEIARLKDADPQLLLAESNERRLLRKNSAWTACTA